MYAASLSCTPKRPDSPRWIGFFRFRLVHLLFIGASLFAASFSSGQDVILDEGKKIPRRGFIVLPYTFASETWDVAFGVAAGGSGWLADTATTYGAVTGSTNGTWNFTVGGNGYPTLLLDRLYVDFSATYFDYTNLSKGSYQMIALTRDWGALGDARSWTFGEIELSQYFDIGESSLFRNGAGGRLLQPRTVLRGPALRCGNGFPLFHPQQRCPGRRRRSGG